MTDLVRSRTYHGVTHSNDPDGSRKRGDDDASPPADAPSVQWEASGNEAGADASGKKERVLHTRVPAVLERELKKLSENLRVPVSNLVRAILEDAVDAADVATETIEQRLRHAAGKLENERVRIRNRLTPDPLVGVFAFQDIKLARPQRCAKCDQTLAVGASAHLGLTDDPKAARLFVCDACLPTPDGSD